MPRLFAGTEGSLAASTAVSVGASADLGSRAVSADRVSRVGSLARTFAPIAGTSFATGSICVGIGGIFGATGDSAVQRTSPGIERTSVKIASTFAATVVTSAWTAGSGIALDGAIAAIEANMGEAWPDTVVALVTEFGCIG